MLLLIQATILFTSSGPLHFCPRALTIYSLTTARGNLIKYKKDHVTFMLKPLSLSGFLSQNKIQSLRMVCNCPLSYLCYMPSATLPLTHSVPTSLASWIVQGTVSAVSGSWHMLSFCSLQLFMWHTSSFPWPFLKYGNYSLNKDNIRTYQLLRAIGDGDSKQRQS